MWIRAVWMEGQHEEGVIPDVWEKDGTVFWPPGKNADKAMKERRVPAESWREFRLVKVKTKSGTSYLYAKKKDFLLSPVVPGLLTHSNGDPGFDFYNQ